MQTNAPYHWLADYYDAIFSGSRGPLEAARRHILARILPGVQSACDLACGTGTTAVALAQGGTRTFAVDVSPGMCRAARQKSKAAGVAVRVIRADMRSFRVPELVDLVTCECDAINHIPHRKDLRRVANCVALALRPGGYFYFDVNNRLGFERYWKSTVWFEKPGIVLVMRNHHDPGTDRAWSDIEWFIREGRHWRRHHEHVEEVCWTADEVVRTLRAAGFDRVQAFDQARFFNDPIITRGCRTVYLARKAAA